MQLQDVLFFIGGICLFLYGMHIMGEGLEKSAGNQLKGLLAKLTSNPVKGFLLGAGVTAIIQSSSATTVMLVGFVNSGIMTLSGAIPIIMGANVGTTITAWLLSLTGVEGSAWYMQLLKPVNFSAALALLGVIFCVFMKSPKKKDIGTILLGFAILFYGMNMMSDSVEALESVFQPVFEALSNPILGVLAGAGITGIIQSSSASVGILQMAASSVFISHATALPIIMGQNIGTCVTALISSIGANKNAKRVGIVHLSFNIIGTTVLLILYGILFATVEPLRVFMTTSATNELSISIMHTGFNIICTLLLLPFGKQLEKLSYLIIKDGAKDDKTTRFDDRLLATPTFALESAKKATVEMASEAKLSIYEAMELVGEYDKKRAEKIRNYEDNGDKFEDDIGSYLLKITALDLTESDSREATKLLHSISDLERLTDHAVNIAESAEEMAEKNQTFTADAQREISIIMAATKEIVELATESYITGNLELARRVEPLEEVIDDLQSDIKLSHITRLKNNQCTIEVGFVLNDLLTNLERVADHCSNLAGCVIEIDHAGLGMHSYTESVKDGNARYDELFEEYSVKYSLLPRII
ncbi:MAG: Na/Pi cotransporter family protein [Clostridia bacterium]|nr:Na/Pi cotransporter family protein [Clostridia bacterium]